LKKLHLIQDFSINEAEISLTLSLIDKNDPEKSFIMAAINLFYSAMRELRRVFKIMLTVLETIK